MNDYKSRALALVKVDEFVPTSSHRNWRGKISCLHCNSTGYAGSVATNPYWWGQRHGRNCVEKGFE